MALTAFPTITFNSGTGSDSLASGAGPATAITGTCAASTNSTTVTFNGNPDLSGVAQDGSHVLWVNGIGFVRISTVDDAANTCVVETALTIGASAAFAIGGKRATLDETESRRLFAATSAPTASGASGQWEVSLEDDQSITSAVVLAASQGTGRILIRSSSTSTRRTITSNAAAAHFSITATGRYEFRGLVFLNSNGSPGFAISAGAGGTVAVHNCICGSANGVNCPQGLYASSSSGNLRVVDSAIIRCTGVGINGAGNAPIQVVGCDISRCGSHGISGLNTGSSITKSIIAYNGGSGITFAANTGWSTNISDNTIDGNTAAGLLVTNSQIGGPLIILNNQFTNNGTYGVNFSGTIPHTPVLQHNNFYGNTTAAANGITPDATNLTADPGYTDRTNTVRNYAISSASTSKAAGFPASTATIGAGQSGTTSYVDIGAAQRQESGGGIIRTGMNGGFL